MCFKSDQSLGLKLKVEIINCFKRPQLSDTLKTVFSVMSKVTRGNFTLCYRLRSSNAFKRS